MAKANHPCAHCGESPATRPRGLCWRCYYNPYIRATIAWGRAFVRRGVLIKLRQGVQQPGRVKPASHPTNAAPGSAEKVLVLMQRAELGQELWHPDDGTLADPVELGQVRLAA